MATPSPDLLTLLMIAVEMRIEGATWEDIGKKVHRHERTCRRWPLRYAREWNRLYYQADDMSATRAGLRARAVLQRDLTSENGAIRGAASRALNRTLDQRRALHPSHDLTDDPDTEQRDSQFAKKYTRVKELTHEQRIQELEKMLDRLRAGHDGAGAGREPAASPPPSQ